MEKLALSVPNIQGNGTVQITPPPGIPNGNTFTLGNIATSFLETAIVFGVILSLIYFVYGAFIYMQSRGSKEILDRARRIILYSIIGLLVMSASLVIVSLVTGALGINTTIGGVPTR